MYKFATTVINKYLFIENPKSCLETEVRTYRLECRLFNLCAVKDAVAMANSAWNL